MKLIKRKNIKKKNNNKLNYPIINIDTTTTITTQTTKDTSNTNNHFPNNEISTTKYTRYNFIFKNLFEQFKRYTNIYFLIISILTLIKSISPVEPATSILPLGIILVVTAIKEGYEDFKRYKADNISNNREYLILDQTSTPTTPLTEPTFKLIKSKKLKVGNIIKITNNQLIPADIIIISSSSVLDGICFVETSQLDGESNLKIFKSTNETKELSINKIKCSIKCEIPNNNLYKFKGVLNLQQADDQQETIISLSEKQLLLRGTKLRNTEFIYGIIVYCGHDTKLSLNQKSPPSKYSTVEKLISKSVIGIFAFKMVLVVISTIVGTIITENETNHAWYLWINSTPDSVGITIVKTFFAYLIYLSFLVPMSLLITLEIVKVTQGTFMEFDYLMSWKEKEYRQELKSTPSTHASDNNEKKILSTITEPPFNKHMTVKNSNLNDELALVKYIFSDKTGTLTENKMIFSKCSINGKIYSNPNSGELYNDINQATNENGDTITGSIQSEMVKDFLVNMTCCHSAVSEFDQDGIQIYQSPSPDEISLLNCSKLNQYQFKERENSTLKVLVGNNEKNIINFKLLLTMEFTSERKRMSIVLSDPLNPNYVTLYSKGADSIMFSRLSVVNQDQSNLLDKTKQDISDFSTLGLRTLILTKKQIPLESFNQWYQNKYQTIMNQIENRDELLDQLFDEYEKDLTLLGCTAIEDKLQDGVPETIEFLLKCNIKIWMITGDKQETAINIGYSCKLLQASNKLLILNSSTIQDCKLQLDQIISEYIDTESPSSTEQFSLVVDGESLSIIFINFSKEFLKITSKCHTVICCRTSPIQKSLIVRMVKKSPGKPVCLSIGDGANDVSMIQEANIGIGIFGSEGTQASRASDYSLLRFRHLSRLITVHGRYSMIRNAACTKYSFTKNISFFFIQFLFSIHSGWSSQTLFDDAIITTFNTVITALPPFIMAIFEKDVNEEILECNPILFRDVQDGQSFKYITIIKSIIGGIYQSTVMYFGLYLLFRDNDLILNQYGKIGGLVMMGSYCASFSILSILLKAALDTKYWNFIVHIGIWGSCLLYIIISLITSSMLPTIPNYFNVFQYSLSLLSFYCMVSVMIVISLLPFFSLKFIKLQFYPSNSQILKEQYKFKTDEKNKKQNNL